MAQSKEERAAKMKAWAQANKSKINAASKKWKLANPGRIVHDPVAARAYQAIWYAKNQVAKNARNLLWAKTNAARHCANVVRRKAAVDRAIPPWADALKIALIYERAREVTALTGIPHEVDHEIPLRGRLVSGLHVQANLRVITQRENRCKFNHFIGN